MRCDACETSTTELRLQPKLHSRLSLLAALAVLLLASCQVVRKADDQPERAAIDGAAAPLRSQSGEIPSSTGCRLGFENYLPDGPVGDVHVVLAHGFLRSSERMQVLAARLAASGIPTATIDLCNMRPWDGAHQQNGRDMRALARYLDARRVIYAGFSAGGLAAVLAASEDPRTIGVLAMDLVDRDEIGVLAAAQIDAPVIGLTGDASSCNANNNGLAVYAAAPNARVVRIDGATHCDFEAPTDDLCRLVCEDSGRSGSEADALRARILDLAVASVVALAGADRVGVTASTIPPP